MDSLQFDQFIKEQFQKHLPYLFFNHGLLTCKVCDWYPFGEYLVPSHMSGEVFQLPKYPGIKYQFISLHNEPIGFNEGDPIYIADFVGYNGRIPTHIISTDVNEAFVLQPAPKAGYKVRKSYIIHISYLCIISALIYWC